jgi:hypothetical protein
MRQAQHLHRTDLAPGAEIQRAIVKTPKDMVSLINAKAFDAE